MRRTKGVMVNVHPSLYSKMEELRKMYEKQSGKRFTQVEATKMLSHRINMPKKINIFGGLNGKIIKKKR